MIQTGHIFSGMLASTCRITRRFRQAAVDRRTHQRGAGTRGHYRAQELVVRVPVFFSYRCTTQETNGLRWSGRRGSNPRRPAWEVTRHFNFRHLESAGVGLESTETPGKTAVHRERLLMECNWSAVVLKNQQCDSLNTPWKKYRILSEQTAKSTPRRDRGGQARTRSPLHCTPSP